MGRRFHDARFPLYSQKSIYGPMPGWVKHWHHRLTRRRVKVGLRKGKNPLPVVPKSKTENMWT